MSEGEKNLRAVFDRAPDFTHRFRARGYGNGGTGWGVWDCKAGRFLELDEVVALTESDLEEQFVQ